MDPRVTGKCPLQIMGMLQNVTSTSRTRIFNDNVLLLVLFPESRDAVTAKKLSWCTAVSDELLFLMLFAPWGVMNQTQALLSVLLAVLRWFWKRTCLNKAIEALRCISSSCHRWVNGNLGRTEAILLLCIRWWYAVLVSAGTELTPFLVAGTALCFGFSVRMMLITHWCFSCC